MLSEHASPLALLGSEDAGGQNVYVDELARHLAKRGYAVDVFVRRDRGDVPEIVHWAPRVRIVHLEAGPAAAIPKDAIWPYMPHFRDGLLRFAARDGARYDVLHGNFWMSGWVALEARPELGAPVVQIFHALGTTKRKHQRERDSSPIERIPIESRVAREADLLLAPCPSEADTLVEDYGAESERIVQVPLGVNLARFRPIDRLGARARLGLDPRALLAVYVGRMLPRKDVRNIVRALALLRRRTVIDGAGSLRLLVVGGDSEKPDETATPELGELARLASELGVRDRVVFTGKRQPDDLALYYGAADIVVTTPHYEPFGLTPLEAMACARPVIGSAVGGIAYTVRDGETGLLVPPHDPDALARALTWLCERPDVRERMGRAGRARVEREFTWDVVAARTAMWYERIRAMAWRARDVRRAASGGAH
jgi:glycosyltransferase involved in cell wall biosynthesis